MKKYNQHIRYMCYFIIVLLLIISVLPSYTAHTNTSQKNVIKTSHDCEVKDVKPNNNDDEAFFDFAIIWGPFEVRWGVFPLLEVVVYNRAPWYNNTMNVIGYQSWEGGKWVVKKSYWIECNYRHVGFVGRNWLFVIGWGNVAAFS